MEREEILRSIPMRNPEVSWEENKSGKIRISVERKEFIYKIMKMFTGKPKIEKVSLDTYGSFIWKQIDGKKSVQKIKELLEDEYEDELVDVRERTYKYFRSLNEYEFVLFMNSKEEI